jgi:hypothetical protein
MGTKLTVDSNTRALWQADGSGNLIDATGNYPLTKVGAISSVPGLVDNAVRIDSASKYYTHPGNAALRALFATGVWSIEATVKGLANGGGAPNGGLPVLAFEDPAALAWGLLLQVYAADAVYLHGGPNTGGPGFTTTTHAALPVSTELATPPSATWMYVAVTSRFISPGNYRLTFYIDGRSVAEAVNPVAPANFATGALVIGSFYNGGPSTIDATDNKYGDLNEVRLSTIERTPAEIRAQWLAYNTSTGPVAPAFYTTSIAAFSDRLELTMNLPVSLAYPATLPASWSVVGGTVPVTVTSVSAAGSKITVGITEPKGGEALTVLLPTHGIVTP